MDDHDALERIHQLVEEEHALMQKAPSGGLADNEHDRLRRLEVQLDQCWDLLRQRRARRDAGQDPDEAAPRNPSVVERYQQ